MQQTFFHCAYASFHRFPSCSHSLSLSHSLWVVLLMSWAKLTLMYVCVFLCPNLCPLPFPTPYPLPPPFHACLAVAFHNSFATLQLAFIIYNLFGCVSSVLVACCGRSVKSGGRWGGLVWGDRIRSSSGCDQFSLCIAYFDTLTCIKSVGRCPLSVP